MAPTDFIRYHEQGGQRSLSWSETPRLSVGLRGLSWSETPRLSVGLRVQVRRRVAGDDPRTDQNNDGKGVKRAEVPPAENFPGCSGGCLSAWSSVYVSWSWSCACLLSVPVLGAGWWSRVPWPLHVSLSSLLFASIATSHVQICVLLALFLKLRSPWMYGSRISCCFP